MDRQNYSLNIATEREQDAHLIEHTNLEQSVFSGKMLQVQQDQVSLPNGKSATREYIRHPGASCIVPLVGYRRLIMVRQYRYAVKRVMLELPAGKLSPDELPLVTAQRELAEETGWVGNRWDSLGICHPCIGYSDEVIHYFVALELTPTPSHPDDEEFVEWVEMPVSEVLRQVDAGIITDSKTLAGLMMAQRQGYW
jgi:ADP-ribose pyrophosphatase